MKRSTIAAMILLAGTTGLCAAEETRQQSRVDGSIESVTVYRGQALVTRAIDLDFEPGIHEVVVGDLPSHIVQGSLHAEAGTDVSIRSVRYREQPVREDVRSEVEGLDRMIASLRNDLARLARRAETIEARKAYIRNLESFTSENAMSELSKGVLDAATLKELSEYIFEQQELIEKQEIALRLEREQIEAEIALYEREKAAIGAGSTRTARDAVITIEIREGDGHDLRLRYLVNRATWEPSHTVRADIDNETLIAEYFASIQQTSGEDWDDVRMHLSTATPSLVARAPQFTAMKLELAPLGSRGVTATRDFGELQTSQQAAISSRNSNIAVFGNSRSAVDNFADLDRSLNRISMDYQLLELQSGFVRTGGSQTESVASAGHTVTYSIPGRTVLPSRSERQLIQIASTPMEGDFYKVATPLLTSFVYEEARVTNDSPSVLLGGQVTTYANGQFVGYSMFDDIAIGEEMIVGLGINSDLRAERVVIDQKEDIQGGNRVVTLTVQLTVQNFGTEATVVRLMDRLPQVDPSLVQLRLLDDGAASSNFVDEDKASNADGILTWNLNVPAKAIGDGAASVTYTYSIAHDRQMSLHSATP